MVSYIRLPVRGASPRSLASSCGRKMADIVLPYDPDRSRLSDIGHRARVFPNPPCARRKYGDEYDDGALILEGRNERLHRRDRSMAIHIRQSELSSFSSPYSIPSLSKDCLSRRDFDPLAKGAADERKETRAILNPCGCSTNVRWETNHALTCLALIAERVPVAKRSRPPACARTVFGQQLSERCFRLRFVQPIRRSGARASSRRTHKSEGDTGR